MKDFKEMTPIELNSLANKTKENHELIKTKIRTLLDEVEEKETEINNSLKILENIESKYVELMEVLLSKQK